MLIKIKCPSYLINLIKNFLSERIIIIKFGNLTINHTLSKGCPQGSILGPTIWLIIAESIFQNFSYLNSNLIAFADDFLIISGGQTRRTLEEKGQNSLNEFSILASNAKLKISIEKTTQFTFTHSGPPLKRKPTIKLNNHKIKQIDYLKYLGITFQYNLRWYPHIKNIKTKLNILYNNWLKISGRLWGTSSNLLKFWYLTVVNKIITYACGSWADNLNKGELDLLTKCQRPFLLRICRTYRTAPTIALCTLAGIPPIHISIKYENLQSNLLNTQKNELNTFENHPITLKNSTTHIAPYDRNFNFNFYKENLIKNDFEIFTDGSKSPTGVGAAFVVYHLGKEIHYKEIKLSINNSNYQAESYAIYDALVWIKTNKNNLQIKNLTVFSDSLSSLIAITSFNQKYRNLQLIQKLLLELSFELNINLTWLKAHTGIEGNESADKHAKAATLKELTDIILPLPISYIKKQLKTQLINEWQLIWNNAEQGRLTYTYIPKIKDNQLFSSPYLNTLLTNHGPFPSYHYRFKLVDIPSPLCICGSFGNSEHYMFQCKLTKSFHFKKPSSEHNQKWTQNINNNKFLLNKTKNLITWLNENIESLYSPR
jgi:ribonuclease HI